MKRDVIKRILSSIIVTVTVMNMCVAFAETTDAKELAVGFDEEITNMGSPAVVTVGSNNARVVQDGDRNKAYSTDIGFVSNEISIPLPSGISQTTFVVSADMKFVNDTADGELVLRRDSTKIQILKITNGNIITTDGKSIGSIGKNKYNNIAIKFDTILNLFSVYINNRCVLDKWALSEAAPNMTAFGINLDAGNEVEAYFMLDNIYAYNSSIIKKTSKSFKYNDTIMDFTPFDETGISKAIYINNNLDDPNNLGMVLIPKRNRINKISDDKSGNGYIEFENVESADDMYTEIKLPEMVKNVVLEVDFMYEKDPKNVNLFYLRDSSDSSNVVNIYPFSFNDGKLTDYGNKNMNISKGKWHTISTVVNLKEHYMDVYCDGELFLKNKTFNGAFNKISIWRFYSPASAKNGHVLIDNVRAYGGTEPRDISNEKAKEVSIYTDLPAKEVLAGKTALSPHVSKIYYDGKKEDTKLPVIIEGDEALVSADDFEELFAEKLNINGDTISVGSKAKFVVGDKNMFVGNKNIAIAVAPIMHDGQVMIPVKAYGENVLPKGHFYDDEHGMFLVSKTEIDTSDSKLRDANMYLFFERKSADELKKIMQSHYGEELTEHPRVMITKTDVERLKDEIRTDKYKKLWFEGIKQSADSLLDTKPSEYIYNDGNRLFNVAMQVESRCLALGFAYQITNDKKYAERCIEELIAVCSFPDWNPQNSCLDTGIMMQGVAVGYDWTCDAMTEEQRTEIQNAILRLGVGFARSAFYGQSSYNTFWTKTITNWSTWAVSGMFNLALAVAEADPDYCLDTAEKALRAIEYGIYNIAPDGAWNEGPMYWHWFIRALAYGLKGYETAFGEIHEGIQMKGVDGLGVYQAHFSGPTGNVNDYHDSDSGKISDVGQFYIGYALGDLGIQKQRIEYMNKNSEGGSVYDIIYYDVNADSVSANDTVPLDAYFRGAEFVSMRQNWTDDNALWVSTHAGLSNQAHDHIDVGAFVMEMDGIRWATDFGKEQLWYKDNPAEKAGYDTILYYRRKGEGHNIVVINPDNGIEYDRTKSAKISEIVSGKGRAYSKIDLSELYHEEVNSYTRGYLLSEGRRAFTVKDEIELKNDNSTLYWFMHTKGEIKIIDKNTATIYQDGKTLKVQLATSAQNYELMEMEAKKLPTSINDFEETDNNLEGYTKLAVKIVGSGKIDIAVKMSMLEEAPSATPVETTPIELWTVEGDDNIVPPRVEGTATLDNIKVGNGSVYAFNPKNYRYSYTLGESESLSVTPIAEEKTDVKLYPQKNGSTLAEIRIFDEIDNYKSYYVEIKPYNPNDAGSYHRFDIISTEASSCQADKGNYPEGSADGDLSTRWSADGKGEWLVHDLGTIQKFTSVGVALWQGAKRNFYFKILVSNDKENWMEILDAESCGTTEEIEIFHLNNPVEARYIKYLGDGNSVNNWNNVIELAVLTDK